MKGDQSRGLMVCDVKYVATYMIRVLKYTYKGRLTSSTVSNVQSMRWRLPARIVAAESSVMVWRLMGCSTAVLIVPNSMEFMNSKIAWNPEPRSNE